MGPNFSDLLHLGNKMRMSFSISKSFGSLELTSILSEVLYWYYCLSATHYSLSEFYNDDSMAGAKVYPANLKTDR